MSALGQKRAWAAQQFMSALPPIAPAKADLGESEVPSAQPTGDYQIRDGSAVATAHDNKPCANPRGIGPFGSAEPLSI